MGSVQNDLEKLQKIIRDEKIERQKIFEIDIDKISITKVTEKVDVLRCCTDMKDVLHYDGLKSVILPEKFDEYISILGFNEQEQESWKRAYKLVNEQVRLNESSEEKLMETSSEVSEHETFINPEDLSIDFSDTCSIGEKFETTKPPSPSPKPKRQQQVEATKLATDPHPKRFKKL
jgi:hypothetical protein